MKRATSACGSARNAGFTLLELLVVMTILVLLAVAMPAALNRALPARRVAVASDAMTALVRHAQALSAVSGKPARLVLEGQKFSLKPSEVASVKDRNPRNVTLRQTTRARLTSRNGTVVRSIDVFADGSTSGARIELTDSQHRKTIHVGELTGQVRVDHR